MYSASRVHERTPLLLEANGATAPDRDDLTAQQPPQDERQNVEASTDAPIDGRPTKTTQPPLGKLMATMGCLWLCTFFAALDTTILATLAGPIAASFNSPTAFTWIANAYILTNAACQPLSGKLTDIYGRRDGLLLSTVLFAAGTLMCGLAQNAAVIIAGRALAGVGGGCLSTITTFVGSDLVPLRNRGLLQGIGNIVFGSGVALGGLLGGFVNDRFGWRYAFIIQVPFILFGGIIGFFQIAPLPKDTPGGKLARVDFLGSLSLVAALILFLLGLQSGGVLVRWDSPLVVASFVLSSVALAFFVFVEARIAPEPIIPLQLFRHRSVASACFTSWFVSMSMYGLMYHVPVLVQVTQQASATEMGAVFLPQGAGAVVGSLGSGLVMGRTGRYYYLNLAIQVPLLLSCVLLLVTSRTASAKALPFVALSMAGFSHGAVLTVALIALIAAVEHSKQAVVTSASYAFRSTGASIGITAASITFQAALKARLETRFRDWPQADRLIQRALTSADEIQSLPVDWRGGVRESYIEALRCVWVIALGFAILMAIASLFLRENTLDEKGEEASAGE